MYHIKKRTRINLRFVVKKDLPTLVEIDEQSFPSSPWGLGDFQEFMKKAKNPAILVAETATHDIAGYVAYSLSDSSLFVACLAIRPCYRRQGVGRQIICKLLTCTSAHRRPILCELRESNLEGQLFLREMGFLATRVKRATYENGEDSYCFRYDHD